ncbi:MAG: DUF2807 domain-containing protein [Pseudomonadota bacterium]|nr:DUF2807 domain-containing protein [Pseudomonadota bacterium]
MHQPRRFARTFVVAACLLACAAPLTQTSAQAASWGWNSETVNGSGVIARQQRELGHFSGVSNGLAANVDVRIGDTESVTIEADDNVLPLIETVIENGLLKIQTSKRNLNLRTTTLKIVIQAKSLDRISLGGSGSINTDPLRARTLKLDLGGSGTINVKRVEADSVSINVGGSGDVLVGGGSASTVSVSIGGSGTVKMGAVRSDSVNVNVAGSGDVTVWARDTLHLKAFGSGDVHYYGDPKVSSTVLGSGRTNRLGAAPN